MESETPSLAVHSRRIPDWAAEIVALYESNAASQFILHGNVQDRFILPLGNARALGSLSDFFLRVLMPRFDVVLSYDLGNGLRIEKGGEVFSQWQGFKDQPEMPKAPRAAVEYLTRYFRYAANLSRLGLPRISIGCLVHSANLVAPAVSGSSNYELNALAMLMRDWASDALLAEHSLVSCLITENLADLHPLLASNPRAPKIKLPLPSQEDLRHALEIAAPQRALALAEYVQKPGELATQLTGATQNAIDSLLKLKEYRRQKLLPSDVAKLKKQLVEEECQGLIEFIESKRTLEDLYGQDKLKAWLRQDIALWRQNDLQALPMGYLICGPVGTGKTFMVECLAGEAGVPVVKIKNFRDKWVGSTEGNLEKIFRLLQAMDRCFVFIDEADQALGRRDSGANDAGLSGRIYSMMAAEMSRPENRGRIIWVLASSRPDLIEVDLKRPGRVDVKIPIFPAGTAREAFELLGALCRRQGVGLVSEDFAELEALMPQLLTPGAAEALAMKIYRLGKTQSLPALEATRQCLVGYQNPVAPEVMKAQIRLAVEEASDLDFVPEHFRGG